jgi:hypothetical protein
LRKSVTLSCWSDAGSFENDFVEALALGQSLPGTSGGNAVTYLGSRLRGWRGATVSLTGFIPFSRPNKMTSTTPLISTSKRYE